MTARPLRVLQVVLSLNAGGTERLVIELARRLNVEIPMAVACLDDEGVWAGELLQADIPVDALHRPGGFVPRLGRAIANLAARHDASVLHCHHYSPFVYGALARFWRPSLRVVYTEHGRLSDAPPSRKRALANSVFGRLPHAAFCVSGDLRQHLVEEGFPPAAVGVIYNGIDIGPLPDPGTRHEVRRQLGAGDRTLVIGTIARLDPVKDLTTLIRALATLAHDDALLIVVGDGPERARLETDAATAGVASRIRFLGYRDDARRWLAGCDVYVNCSISEGVSLTILEAMAAGLAIVATGVGGTPEVVDAASGQLIDARDVDALRAALDGLAADPQRREVLATGARERVERLFALDRMVREYRDVYLRLST